jgi:predicted metal-binding membrane protein
VEARYGRLALSGAAGFILLALLGLAGVAWFYTVSAGPMIAPEGAGELERIALFVTTWTVMMAAMMFPAVAPVVLVFSLRAREQDWWPARTATFVAGYLLIWIGFGAAAYLFSALLARAASQLTLPHPALLTGAVIAIAGLYQLTPLKNTCLAHCRTPLHWMLRGLRPGLRGGFQMGVSEGVFCVGCCLGLMAVLLAVGMTSVAWMALIAAVIFVEKVLAPSAQVARLVATALVALGLVVALSPAAAELLLPAM